MKRHHLVLLSLLCLFILTSCANGNYCGSSSENLLKETWLKQINLDTRNWTCRADSWFLTGMPNRTERYLACAPMQKAIGKTHLRITNFQNIVSSGSYQIQMIRANCDRIFILGPNAETRQVAVTIFNNTLYISQVGDRKHQQQRLNNVIIRISIRCLRNLVNAGSGSIYGRDIMSNALTIRSCGNGGKVMLVGNMNLRQINQTGTGSIVVIGAYTPCLNIKAGNGNVYVSGRVGIQNIRNAGNGCINIIGADTDSLNITASGNGITTLVGYVNLKKVMTYDRSRVYLYSVNSPWTYVSTHDKSRVGIAGRTLNLTVDAMGSSRFYGQSFYAENAYVKVFGKSHANISAHKKAFTSANGNGSIYFFGSQNILSTYTTGRGIVIPVWNNGNCVSCPLNIAIPRSNACCPPPCC